MQVRTSELYAEACDAASTGQEVAMASKGNSPGLDARPLLEDKWPANKEKYKEGFKSVQNQMN